jgi:hypothetical protein
MGLCAHAPRSRISRGQATWSPGRSPWLQIGRLGLLSSLLLHRHVGAIAVCS